MFITFVGLSLLIVINLSTKIFSADADPGNGAPCYKVWRCDPTCSYRNECPAKPPVYIPPPRPPATPGPPGSPPEDPPQQDDCPCGRDGIGNCNWAACGDDSNHNEPARCNSKYSPLWIRVYSNEGGKNVAWKNWINVEPRVDISSSSTKTIKDIYWSGTDKVKNIPFDSQIGINNGTRYLKNFNDRNLVYELYNGGNSTIFWEGDSLGNTRQFDEVQPFKNSPPVVWDSSINRIDNQMDFEFYTVDPNTNQPRQDGVMWPPGVGITWSDHFCAKGKANISENGFLGGNPKCARVNDRNCDEEGENADGTCDKRIKYCSVDDDGCRGFFSTSKPGCSTNDNCTDYGYFDNLDALLRFSNNKYSGNWSMSMMVMEEMTNPKSHYQCMLVTNVLKFKAPEGYRCNSFKFYTNTEGVGVTDDTGKTVEYMDNGILKTQRINNIVWEDPSNPRVCNISYEPKSGNLLLIEITPDTTCKIDTNVTCDTTNSTVNVNYNATNIKGGTPVRSVIRMNQDPLADWYNDDFDKFAVNQNAQLLSGTTNLPIDMGILHDYRVSLDVSDGSGGFTEICSSAITPFVCNPPRPDYCSASTIINHNYGSSFEIASTTTENIGLVSYYVFNTDNKDINGNSIPVCIPASGEYSQGACPAGSKQLAFAYPVNPESSQIVQKFNYSDIFVIDKAWNDQIVKNVQIKTFFAKNSTSIYADEDAACNLSITKYEEPVINPTCLAPDTQSNPDSNSCGSFLRPLIQHKGDPLTIRHKMSGIDPNTKIKFDWADSMPLNSGGCQSLYRINIWELGINGEYLRDAVSMATQDSEYELDSKRLDFGKTYAWEVIAMGVQKNSCGYSRQRSDIYTFTTNSFPLYVKSGFAYSRTNVSNISINQGTSPVSGADIPACDGNVNCIKRFSPAGDWWGGNACYSGNLKYTDTQNPVGTSRRPDNPITYWFEYFDAENSWGDACKQNEMQLHRLAIVRKGQLANLADSNLSTVDSTLEVKNKIESNQIDGIYVEFDVSSVVPERVNTFTTSKANINAYRYLDEVNRMRIIYEVEFKEGISTGDYEVFGSMVGTALDPRGVTISSSVLMYDLPFDWNNQGIESVNGIISPIQCDDNDPNDDNDDDCTCPGACCDKFPDDVDDFVPDPDPDPDPQPAPQPEPRPEPRPQPPPRPRPPVQKCKDEETCVEKPIRICHNEEGNCWCPDPTILIDGACKQECDADEYICMDDWETVCTIKTICV
ncbi:hypothetical protein KBD45_01030 [Candidatus Dojkabacteria bacterium]|nr:hypothetical protein [Candidatus Dojkabacteria bacterium]